MVKLFVVLAGLAAASVHAAPLERRIAQEIAASTQKWEQACRAAGGGERCNPISVTAFSTLLAGAGACEQQDSGDVMVDLAKELGNDAEMIRLAQIFVQQPRNTPTSLATPYCQKAPKNAELNGLFQCQFQGANQERFAGGASIGAAGTIPFGLNAPLNPLGACPANTAGPIPDGTQLVDRVQSAGAPAPGAPAPPATSTTSTVTSTGTAAPTSTSTSTAATTTSTVTQSTSISTVAQTTSTSTVATETATTTTTRAPAPTQTGNGNVQRANAEAAQKLNARFATLRANSACENGEIACVGTAFAQCVEERFVTIACPANTICAALPLVNAAGTSVTCATKADAEDRIARTGARGGLTGAAGANDRDRAGQGAGNAAERAKERIRVVFGNNRPAQNRKDDDDERERQQGRVVVGRPGQNRDDDRDDRGRGNNRGQGNGRVVTVTVTVTATGAPQSTSTPATVTRTESSTASTSTSTSASTTSTSTSTAPTSTETATSTSSTSTAPASTETGTVTSSTSTSTAPASTGTDTASSTSTSTAATSTATGTATSTTTPAPAPTPAGDFKLANGQAAQAQNKEFAALTPESRCQAGAIACVNGGFAQCVAGQFIITECAGGAKCFALPLVNAAGTSVTCANEADALARIAASGATGGITGA